MAKRESKQKEEQQKEQSKVQSPEKKTSKKIKQAAVAASDAVHTQIPANKTQQAEVLQEVNSILQQFDDIQGTKAYLHALELERKKVLAEIESGATIPEKKDKPKPWYNYVFPEAPVEVEIASSAPKCDNSHLMQLAKLTLGTFYYIIYLDKNDRLRCTESGDITKMEHYDYEKDNAAVVRIRQAENFPTAIMLGKYRRMFLYKLGLAHEMRYNGCYDQVEPLVLDAQKFAAERNMSATRMWTLFVASVWALMAVLLIVMIHYLVPSWGDNEFLDILKSQGMFAGLMGFLGGYTSLWLRYRSLCELTFGGHMTVAMVTTCRLLIGSIFAYIAVLAMRSGLLFSTFDGHEAAVGIISFVAGFSERLIPSFIQRLAKNEDENPKKQKDTNIYPFKITQTKM